MTLEEYKTIIKRHKTIQIYTYVSLTDDDDGNRLRITKKQALDLVRYLDEGVEVNAQYLNENESNSSWFVGGSPTYKPVLLIN